MADTKTVLEGVNVSTLKLDEINCILNLRDAWNFTLSNINKEINLEYICNVNSGYDRVERPPLTGIFLNVKRGRGYMKLSELLYLSAFGIKTVIFRKKQPQIISIY